MDSLGEMRGVESRLQGDGRFSTRQLELG